MNEICLISTEHLEDSLWFRDEDDFRVAMNYIAIQAANMPEIKVMAFILMSNHLHFVFEGRREGMVSFVNRLKQRYSAYYQKKYGIRSFLKRNGVDVRGIPSDDEAVERAVAYVLMNCVAANICAFCNQYAWGTGGIIFNPSRPEGKRAGDFSERALERLLRSGNVNIPDNWIIGKDGYILPWNYVDVLYVERIFRTPRRFNYFLNSSSKAKKRLCSDENLPAFLDHSIVAVLPDLCRSLFRKDSFDELNPQEQSELARQIRFRFSADATQVARVCGISYAGAARLLDSI